MLGNLFFITVFILLQVNCADINEIIVKFDEEKCIEDNFLDPEIFLQAPQPREALLLNKNVPLGKNSLSVIHELSQLNKIEYYYYLEREEGPVHSKVFYVSLTLGSETYKGDGMSIKEAKRHAAEEALLHTNYVIPEYKENYADKVLTPTVELNNLATKLGMKVTYLSEDELIAERFIYKQKNFTVPGDKTFKSYRLNHTIFHPYQGKTLDVPKENQQGRPFKVGVIVGDMRFIGVGYTLQIARHEAAKNALTELRKLSSDDIEQCVSKGTCNPDNNKSPISSLYELAQSKKVHVNFEIVQENGPAHQKEFVTKCQFGDLSVEGVGKSKKKSKRDASEKMLEMLKSTSVSSSNEMELQALVKKKNKKKKLIKSGLEKFTRDAKNFIASTWQYAFPDEDSDSDNDSPKSKKNKLQDNENGQQYDFKKILLGLTQEHEISVQFGDVGIQNTKHYSLVFIGIEPKQVCLGIGESYSLAQQEASKEALNFFHKLGIENIIPNDEKFKEIQNMDFGKISIVAKNVPDHSDSKKE